MAPERCTGSGAEATGVYTSTSAKWFGQRFGRCQVCGAPVRVAKGTTKSTQHNDKRSDR